MPLTQEDAQLIATDWVNAWNKKDLEAILRHYDGDVQFRSPRAIASYEQHKVGLHGPTGMPSALNRQAKINNPLL